MRKIKQMLGVLVGVVVALLLITPTAAQSPTASLGSLKLPFRVGTAWKVLQGYNGGTHVPGPEQYALDLVLDGGASAGADVIAPASGTLWFAQAPGANNGCMSILIDGGGGLIVQMCHMLLSRVMQPNERISAGALLGTIGEAGAVGNNGTAHLHLSLHRTPDYGVTRIPAPFASGSGLSLEGMNLPPDGSRNQYACTPTLCVGRMTSSNGSAAVTSPASPAATPPSVMVPAPPAAPRAINAAPPTPVALRVGVRAVVAGTGDCVNVRETPGLAGKALSCLPDGARLRIIEGPVAADAMQWWRLDGLGWAVSSYLTALAPTLEIGSTARVVAGRGDCLNVRSAPARAAPPTDCLADGRSVRITGGPVEADGIVWWRLDAGWVSGEFLALAE